MNVQRNQDVSKLPIFQCKMCELRLQIPIMKIDLGNICEECYNRNPFTGAIRNFELEENMTNLYVKCRYESRGCCFEGTLLAICQHEKICALRKKVCPFVYEDECDSFQISDVITHIKCKHKDRIVFAKNYSITVKNPMSPKYGGIYLISTGVNRYYLLRIKNNIQKQLLAYIFYYFENNIDNYNFTLLIKNENYNISYRTLNAHHESKITSSFDWNHSLSVSQFMLESDCREEMLFAINFENDVDEEKLECLECPICKEYMLNNIYMCNNGHSICNNCKQKLVRCPTCQLSSFSRNLCFEQLINLYKLPCRNSDCNKYIRGSKYTIHEANCSYTLYNCPFQKTSDRCSWKGLYDHIKQHLITNHEGYVHRNGDTLNISPSLGTIHTRCFIIQKSVLECSYELSCSILRVSVNLINPNYYRNLICELHINGDSTYPNYYIFTQTCKKESNVKEVIIADYLVDKELTLKFYFSKRM